MPRGHHGHHGHRGHRMHHHAIHHTHHTMHATGPTHRIGGVTHSSGGSSFGSGGAGGAGGLMVIVPIFLLLMTVPPFAMLLVSVAPPGYHSDWVYLPSGQEPYMYPVTDSSSSSSSLYMSIGPGKARFWKMIDSSPTKTMSLKTYTDGLCDRDPTMCSPWKKIRDTLDGIETTVVVSVVLASINMLWFAGVVLTMCRVCCGANSDGLTRMDKYKRVRNFLTFLMLHMVGSFSGGLCAIISYIMFSTGENVDKLDPSSTSSTISTFKKGSSPGITLASGIIMVVAFVFGGFVFTSMRKTEDAKKPSEEEQREDEDKRTEASAAPQYPTYTRSPVLGPRASAPAGGGGAVLGARGAGAGEAEWVNPMFRSGGGAAAEPEPEVGYGMGAPYASPYGSGATPDGSNAPPPLPSESVYTGGSAPPPPPSGYGAYSSTFDSSAPSYGSGGTGAYGSGAPPPGYGSGAPSYGDGTSSYEYSAGTSGYEYGGSSTAPYDLPSTYAYDAPPPEAAPDKGTSSGAGAPPPY